MKNMGSVSAESYGHYNTLCGFMIDAGWTLNERGASYLRATFNDNLYMLVFLPADMLSW